MPRSVYIKGELEMKKIIKIAVIAAFSAVAGISAWAIASPVEAVSSGETSPRSLYVQNCARCHGSNGKGQTVLGKRLEADDLTASTASTAKITRVITSGRGKMPAFRKKLTSAQIESLAGYVHSLK
jgi:cytochrome c6